MKKNFKAISLFSGAGGMDIGFQKAGVDVVWANEIDKDACNTYELNNPDTYLRRGDISEVYEELKNYNGIDLLFGGPPCQGFSVAGKMDPTDIRNTLVWNFLDVLKIVKPKAFVIENVKALGTLKKWENVRERIFKLSNDMGYSCNAYILNSSHFGVPQKRERIFFVGFLEKNVDSNLFISRLEKKRKKPKSVREAISHLGPAGTDKNPLTCTAKITLAANPVLRKSPYAGMIFNGMGRPLNLEEASNTLPASMGGNKTPIIDEDLLYHGSEINWVVEYHKSLMENKTKAKYEEAPKHLRRLTIKEAALLQTFPEDYVFSGSKTAIYRQIGNAVPCLLAEVVARTVIEGLEDDQPFNPEQLTFESVQEKALYSESHLKIFN
ncbi:MULTISPECIES: DNA cytosine methyltransferase [Bacillus]|uniref:DNA cytosine methyltransferase n=1 Tax=Bacillus TaxID=1386 RepID=UPI0001F5B3F4|nr:MULTISPECIES: DNA cytosine methyltransferase [Bacillus]ADV93380.1 cytosine-specific methyltransferase [Bacillus subtilis BSn5]KAA0937741.1 DNA cytosine methyltransferase [Bacillus sp. ANT_WA51]MBT2169725.1 DNA cytosine methyltransferase [Bacillus subtilis]MCZ8477697.1 DNA cytosine methyltransferase [Bacillus subtilis]MDD9766067.1 DNA cytosine methyltransferase [Bacillus subtilis]